MPWSKILQVVIWSGREQVLLEDREVHEGTNSIMVLRVLYRIALVLRMVRVVLKLRRARALTGHVQHRLRKTVSQNKRRYKKHGFDLDLTYITNRIMVMATPAFGQHSSYRNDIHIVSRFLAFRHYGCFFIFNLCDTYFSSDGLAGNYNTSMLFHQVRRFVCVSVYIRLRLL